MEHSDEFEGALEAVARLLRQTGIASTCADAVSALAFGLEHDGGLPQFAAALRHASTCRFCCGNVVGLMRLGVRLNREMERFESRFDTEYAARTSRPAPGRFRGRPDVAVRRGGRPRR